MPHEHHESIDRLAEYAPSVTAADPLSSIVDLCLADDDHDWLVLVDDQLRPRRLVERAALLLGEPFERRLLSVGPSTSVRSLARRAALRPGRDRMRPIALCDAQGRYVGLLRVERILAALAA